MSPRISHRIYVPYDPPRGYLRGTATARADFVAAGAAMFDALRERTDGFALLAVRVVAARGGGVGTERPLHACATADGRAAPSTSVGGSASRETPTHVAFGGDGGGGGDDAPAAGAVAFGGGRSIERTVSACVPSEATTSTTKSSAADDAAHDAMATVHSRGRLRASASSPTSAISSTLSWWYCR